jgi:drug/metabolite transporter (DMT)-like permease
VVSTWLLKWHNATKISAFFFTTPLFGVTLSWLILGDQITIHLLGGLVLLAIGLWVING